jgi:uncharacterized damage-inducible protein DinB
MTQLTEAWQISNSVNIYLLRSLPDALLTAKAGGKGKSIAQQFAHMHQVRLMWLKACDPSLLNGLVPLGKDVVLTAELIAGSLEASGSAIALLIESGVKLGKIKGYKPHPTAFMAYLVSHESHHRGQIMLTLQLAGHKLPAKVSYGVWDWGALAKK